MRKKAFKIAQYLLLFSIGVLLLFLAFKDNDPVQMLNDIRGANYFWVFLSMVMGLLAFISRGVRWVLMIESMGYKAKSTNSTYAVIVGYLANLAIPRIGEITRCSALSRVEKIPVDKLLGTVLLERLIDLVFLLLFVLSAFLLEIDIFGQFFIEAFENKVSGMNNNLDIYIIVFSSILSFLLILFLLRKRIAGIKAFQKVRNAWEGVVEGVRSIRKIQKKGLFFSHTLFIWLMYYLMTYVCFFAIPETSALGPGDGLFITTVGGLGMLAPVQGGIGSYHIMVELGMKALDVENGLVFATIVHTAQTLLVLLTGIVATFFLSALKSKKAHEGN